LTSEAIAKDVAEEDFNFSILILISKMAEILISASKFAYSKTLFTFANDLRGN